MWLNVASLLASALLFYYTFRFYVFMSDTKIQDALKLLLNGFLLMVLKSMLALAKDLGMLEINLPSGSKGDLEGLLSLLAYIVIIFAMVRFRRVFMEFEVQKKAIKMLRSVFDKAKR